MANLQLERPLVIFDIESTGLAPQEDRIVELAVVKIQPDGTSRTTVRRLNPGIPIPADVTAIHGIKDEDVANEPSFADIAEKLNRYLADCDLGGYNILDFDVPMLVTEFRRAGIDFSLEGRHLLDGYTIFRKLHPHNLTAAYKFFCGKDLEGAHGAGADAEATWEVIQGELLKHPELPRELAKLAEYSCAPAADKLDRGGRFRWNGDVAIINFGKFKGKPLREVAVNDPGFLKWIISKDFTDEVKKIAADALAGIFPEPPPKEAEK